MEEGAESRADEARASAIDVPEKECRVCHLVLQRSQDIELGCSCKADLSVAHKHCAETWFKLKGNRTCEICGSIARNVHVVGMEEGEVAEQPTEGHAISETANAGGATRNGQHLLNFLLACIIFAFLVSWLCRFNISS